MMAEFVVPKLKYRYRFKISMCNVFRLKKMYAMNTANNIINVLKENTLLELVKLCYCSNQLQNRTNILLQPFSVSIQFIVFIIFKIYLKMNLSQHFKTKMTTSQNF